MKRCSPTTSLTPATSFWIQTRPGGSPTADSSSLKRPGLGGLVEFHAEASEIALPRFLEEGRRFDLAFVDGNHRFDGVFLDLIYLGRLVRGGGIIFVDDFQFRAVAKATSFCTSNLGWTVEEVSKDDDSHQLGGT